MAQPDLSERVAAGFVGVVFDAVIGIALAWLLGVYSSSLGPGQVTVSVWRFAFASAAFFGAIGVLFGSAVGTLLGNVIAGLFALESAHDDHFHVPTWLVVCVLVGAVAVALWLAGRSS